MLGRAERLSNIRASPRNRNPLGGGDAGGAGRGPTGSRPEQDAREVDRVDYSVSAAGASSVRGNVPQRADSCTAKMRPRTSLVA